MARPGDRVTHPRWGPGRIRVVLDGGRRWRVVFDENPRLPRIVAAQELVRERGHDPPAVAFDAPPADLRQSLEALRLGVVPAKGLEALTVSREGELARLDRLLEEGRGMVLLSGHYGAGKTHLMDLLASRALARGFLVARAIFDPVEVPPSHPLRLYRVLTRQLAFPGESACGLRPLLERLVDSPSHRDPEGERFHRYLSPVLWALAHHPHEPEVEELLAAVQGELHRAGEDVNRILRRMGWRGPRLLSLPDYRTFGQILAHLLGGMAVWSRDAGFRGLLVLADEAEYLDHLGRTSREMAENVLRYLAMATLPPESLPFEPAEVYRGGQAVHKQLSPTFLPDQHLVVVGAFTPHPGIDRILRSLVGDADRIVELVPIPAWELAELGERILALQREAYPALSPPEAHRRALQSRLTGAFRRGEITTTRQAARLAVEFWDLYRTAPDRALAALGR